MEESYPYRLAAFLAMAPQNLAEIEKLIAEDRRPLVLEGLNALRLGCRPLGLGVLEEAVNRLEFAFINHQEVDITVHLQAVQGFHQILAEVLIRISPELAPAVEARSLQEA